MVLHPSGDRTDIVIDLAFTDMILDILHIRKILQKILGGRSGRRGNSVLMKRISWETQ